jgi:hypothetical protein
MIRANSEHPHFIALAKELDTLLSVADGEKHNYSQKREHLLSKNNELIS